MQFLLPLLISSSLVSASRHHARDVIRTRTAVTTTTVTVLTTVYDDVPAPPTQPTPAAAPEAETSPVVVAEVKPTETTPAFTEVEQIEPPTYEQQYTSSSQPSPAVPSPAAQEEPSSTNNKPANDKPTTHSSGDSTLERMSTSDVEAIYKTCWNGQLKWPLPNTPNPVVDKVAPQLSIFSLPASKADTLIVHNYCSYDLYFNHFNGGNSLESGKLAARDSIERPLSGTVMKVSKTSDMAKDVLIEYAVAGDGQLYYDLSLITCLGTTDGMENGSTKDCAGHEAGLQLGNAQSKSFQCAAEAWCDDQVYLYQVS